jgi:enoyl-CoA hydratase/carnithine racemase
VTEASDRPVEDKLLAHRDGAVGHIVFNNPARHNAVSLEMWQRLQTLLTDFAVDPSLRVLVISGAGAKAFVSGADISKFESERASLEAVKHYNATSARAYDQLYEFPKPTIAKIQGYCIGGGMNLAACCDIRIAADNAQFGIPAARLGLGYGFTGVNRLARIIGITAATELFYTARRITAHEAHDMGLLNQIMPAAALDAKVAEWTGMIAENAPLTIAAIKQAALEIGKPAHERDLAKLDRMVDACFTSDDYVEGRRAFMEKRPPKFSGT